MIKTLDNKINCLFSSIPGGRISSVSRDAAVGIITLQLILLFLPSIAIVLQRPTRPSLAALVENN